MIFRKTLALTMLGLFLLPGLALAEEMIVNLQSGNALVIRYTGTIHGVTMQSGTDGIAGIEMTKATEKTEVQPSTLPHPEKKGGGKKVVTSGEENKIRLQWADPIGEDQPFPRR